MDLEYVYAAGILHELNREINESNMKQVLNAAGANVSESRVKALIAALEDVDIDRAVADAGSQPAGGRADAAMPEGSEDGEGDTQEVQEVQEVEAADETLPEAADEETTDTDEGDEGSLSGIFGDDES